jgi:hypothetical protein
VQTNSSHVIRRATFSYQSNQTEFTVATFRNPDANLFKGQQSTTVSAWVCAECGFVECYANMPKSIKVAPP